MGDRANVAVRYDSDPNQQVVIYTHWGGSELPEAVRKVLTGPVARARWQDDAYLTRILIDGLSASVGGGAGSETGMGVATGIGDDNYGVLLVVDVKAQSVYFEPIEDSPPFRTKRQESIKDRPPLSFQDFCRQPVAEWPRHPDE